MKVLAAAPNWHMEYDNMPTMKMLVDKLPKSEEFTYCKRRNAYWAEKKGIVRFFVHNPHDERGYGGAIFTCRMKDGGVEQVRGPWSSSSAAMNLMGFPVSCEMTYTDDPKVWEQGFTFTGGHVTLRVFRQACKLAGVHAVAQDGTWYPSLIKGHVVKLWAPHNFYLSSKGLKGPGRVVARLMPYHKGRVASFELSAEQNAVVGA